MTSAGSSGAKHSALIPTFPQRGKAPHQKPGCLPWPTRHWGKAGLGGAGIQVSQQPPRRLAWCMRLTCRRCCVNGRRATCWPCRSPPRHCCHCTRCGTARLALQASVMDAVISPTGRSPDVLVYLPLAGRKSFWTVLLDPVIADIVAFVPLDFLVFAFCAIGLYFLTCRPSSEYLACVFTSIQMREPRRLSDFRHRSVLEERRSQIRPQRGQFLPDLLAHSRSYGPKRR